MNSEKIKRANFWLFLALSLYFLMNGAQLWETAIMVPAWTAAPPESLHFFQEPYGVDFKVFWIVVHSTHELVLIIALIFNWPFKSRRNAMVVLLVIHIGIRAWTLQYFAPTIIEFQAMEAAPVVIPELVEKAETWKSLNYIRVGLFYLVNLGYALLFTTKFNPNQNA
ncbi:transposase [Cyclobacterium plantarum]|uniref:transposase n=1 Tax=Cyclobacterium plantarum TaxID=2716263 RepID=UPI003F6ECE18